MTFENSLKAILAGLEPTTDLTNRYFLLCDANGNIVNKVKATDLHTNGYGYVIVGTMEQ